MENVKGKLISDGGEGYIYEMPGAPDKLLKIFKETDFTGAPIVTDELHAKLKYMRDNPPEVLVSKGIVAWPIELIYEKEKLVGFVMPKLELDEHIQRTYSYRHPKLEAGEYARFPSVESRIKIAINLCSAIDELHRKGYVFGDFNHHNIGVNYSTGQICFMDCDSFHITDDSGNVYRTNVVMPGYLAPEIIKHCNNERAAGRPSDLDTVTLPTFSNESDLFCLAVHIFKLLMNGVDPFRGVKFDAVGSKASPFMGNDAIERDSYVFKPGNKPSAVFCPPADSLPPDILTLFNRTFIDGKNDPTIRADAADWYITLNRFLNNELEQCSKNKKHQYYKYLDTCPYCTADARHLAEHGVIHDAEDLDQITPGASTSHSNASPSSILSSPSISNTQPFLSSKPTKNIIGLTLLLTAFLTWIHLILGTRGFSYPFWFNIYLSFLIDFPIRALYIYTIINVYIVCKTELKNTFALILLGTVLLLESLLPYYLAPVQTLFRLMDYEVFNLRFGVIVYFINLISVPVVIFSILDILKHSAKIRRTRSLWGYINDYSNVPARLAKGWVVITLAITMYLGMWITALLIEVS